MYVRYNRGPHGRMNRHGGRRPGLMILGIIALIHLAPAILAAFFGLLVGLIGVAGGLIAAVGGMTAAFSDILSELPSGFFSGGSLVIGIVIGLILYNRRKNRNAAEADVREEETAGTETPAGFETPAEEYEPTETCHHYGA